MKIKYAVAALALAVFSGNALAITSQDKAETCALMAKLANDLMTTHQAGVPLAQVLEMGNNLSSEETRTVFQQLALKAYSHPRYSTAQMQQKEIAEFRDEWHVTCLKTLKD